MARKSPKEKSVAVAVPYRARMTTTPNSADTEANEHLWRRLGATSRDLGEVDHDKALRIVTRLIRVNGIAGRMTDWIDEWCVGDGISLVSNLKDEAARERHEEALYRLWDEEQTNWPEFQHDIARTVWPVGELLVTIHRPDSGQGVTAYGMIDAEEISEVVTNPENRRQVLGVLRKGDGRMRRFHPSLSWMQWAEGRGRSAAVTAGLWPLPEPGAEFAIPRSGRRAERVRMGWPCEYAGHRSVPGTARGLSGFYGFADLLDMVDRLHFQQMEGMEARNCFAAHFTFEGMNEEDIRKRLLDLAPQIGKPGGVIGTNEKTKIDLKAPSLGAAEFDVSTTTALRMLSGQSGFPETWLGMGTEAGNAATTELAGPALRMLKARQAEVRAVILLLLRHGMAALAKSANLSPEDAADFSVQMPEIGGRDEVRMSQVFVQTLTGIQAGEGTYWTEEKAAKMAQKAATELLGEAFEPGDTPEREEEVAPEDAGPPAEGDPDAVEDMADAKAAGKRAKESRRRRRRAA